MTFLTREQVEQLDYKQCQQALKQLGLEYKLDAPADEYFKEVWDILDDIVNTLLYLEDRIRLYEDPRVSTMSIENLDDLLVDQDED